MALISHKMRDYIFLDHPRYGDQYDWIDVDLLPIPMEEKTRLKKELVDRKFISIKEDEIVCCGA